MGESVSTKLRYVVHGLGVELTCAVDHLAAPIVRALGEFTVDSFGPLSHPITGSLGAFHIDEVMKHVSHSAARVPGTGEFVEVYEEDGRFWLIDDRWGMCELNLIKGQFRSWVLPASAGQLDPAGIVDQAVLGPLSQLMRPRGLCLLPATGVVRDGWGAMIVSGFSLEPELRMLARAGWKIVGQSWVGLREERGKVSMLCMPGMVTRSSLIGGGAVMRDISRVDLTGEFYGCSSDRAGLDAVLLVAPGRRPLPGLRAVLPTNAAGALRRDWPLPELQPHRRPTQLSSRIADACPVFDIQLSRNARDILGLLERARHYKDAPPRLTLHFGSRARQAA